MKRIIRHYTISVINQDDLDKKIEAQIVISQFRIREKCNFSLYTPLEIEISTARSVRKRFCSFSFAGLKRLEFLRIQLKRVVGDDRDGFCPPGHKLLMKLFSELGPFPTVVKLRLFT